MAHICFATVFQVAPVPNFYNKLVRHFPFEKRKGSERVMNESLSERFMKIQVSG
jgi:hypothetical protein